MIFLEQVAAKVEQADLDVVRNSHQLAVHGIVLDEAGQDVLEIAKCMAQVLGVIREDAGPYYVNGIYKTAPSGPIAVTPSFEIKDWPRKLRTDPRGASITCSEARNPMESRVTVSAYAANITR